MKSKAVFLILSCLMAISLVLASCATSSTSTTTTKTIPANTTSSQTTVTNTIPPASTSTSKPTTTSTAAVTGNWWDSLGTPQYGGTLTISGTTNIQNWDSYYTNSLATLQQAYQDELFADDWTLDPKVFSYQMNFRPRIYLKGLLAESWEFTDASTVVVHLRQGIHYQNIPPVNGREFTSADVVYHYDRMYGAGSSMAPSPYTGQTQFQHLISLTAPDKYTVVFKWNLSNPEVINETLDENGSGAFIEAKEAVDQWGDLRDWHHAMGTGPFILTDFVDGSSLTFVRNPNYFGHDERYPQNQLPYIDTLKFLIIPQQATALAALRTGKLDALDAIALQDAQSMQKTNPKILQLSYPNANTPSVDPRNDVKPFNDIRVREAMQMALDLPTITKTYYGGQASSDPSAMVANSMSGYGFPYSQWPQDLKDQYAYNPTAAKQLLAAAGYPNGFNTDIIVSTASDLNLWQIVKSYFDAVGINMTINAMDPASWMRVVRTTHMMDQMAGNNSLGFSFDPLMGFTRFLTGYPLNWCMISDPKWDAMYAAAMAATSADVAKQKISDANLYLAQQHWAISLPTPNFFGLYQPWFKGYNGQNFSISGSGASSPLLLGFYTSRFWIDQNLKKSMGY